jgi:hypothetical protein
MNFLKLYKEGKLSKEEAIKKQTELITKKKQADK